jgi:hypothetical protein
MRRPFLTADVLLPGRIDTGPVNSINLNFNAAIVRPAPESGTFLLLGLGLLGLAALLRRLKS